ncbi:MAG: alpha-glucuronidase family glycosyl hydrolase [Actinopolymorphaceae bacterium]
MSERPRELWTRRRFLAGTALTGTGVALAGSSLLDSAAAEAAWVMLAAPPEEDGYELWLRYRLLVDRPDLLSSYRQTLTHVVAPPAGGTAVERSAVRELRRGLTGILGRPVPQTTAPDGDGALILGTPESSPLVAAHADAAELRQLGPEGFVLRRSTVNGAAAVLLASEGARGVLYGAFHLLRLLQTYRRIDRLDVAERPANPLRLVNHWDNLDRSVERGYAGSSIFAWDDLPNLDPRYTDYARALASVGINGTVVNNVNANAAFLASERLPGLAALAGVFREWGVTFHLSANYASPIVLTRDDAEPIETADPFDPRVQAWWRDKVDEIYALIPDFGGFLVKANSEGQPGPLDYGRTHADGADMLAELVAPYDGIIMWRSFVHEGFGDWAEYQHRAFAPLDGDFAANVAVQTKNGPIDFQVREPVNPLFGALPQTNQMIELQITQEYTGHSTHLCYLVPQWKEVLDFDTHTQGTGPTVASIVDGSAYGQTMVGFAGVVNFGDERNWTGHHLAAANTHGYARLAWNPALGADEIAEEWVRMTFGSGAQVVETLRGRP